MAAALAEALAMIVAAVDRGEATVSREDRQGRRARLFCDRLLSEDKRCALRAGHDGECSPA